MASFYIFTLVVAAIGGFVLSQYLSNSSSAPKSSQAPSSNSTSAPGSRSTRLQTAYSVLEGYKLLSADALIAPLAPGGTHKVLPESLNVPVRDREAFAQHAKGFTSIFSAFEMQPQAVYEAPAQNTVIAYCKMVGTLVGDLGPWHNECMITMRMTEDGTKVEEYKEFVDSARAAILKEKLGAFFASKAKAEKMMSQ